MPDRARLVHAGLLAGAAVPFVGAAWGPSIFVAWSLTAASLAAAWRRDRRAAALGLAMHGLVVLVAVAGSGLTVSGVVNVSTRFAGEFAEAVLMAGFWLPAAVYLAVRPSRRRLSGRWALGILVAWTIGISALREADNAGAVAPASVDGLLILPFVAAGVLLLAPLVHGIGRRDPIERPLSE